MRKVKLLATMLCAVVLLSIAGPAPKATATTAFPIFPTFFPPYSNFGTVISVDDPEGGPSCTLFLDDDGGLFFFNGVDSFAPGTRLLVSGNLCLICLNTLSCGLPASPILNAVAKEI